MAEEVFAQLCTEASKFDGEWKWQAAGMSYIIRTKKNRLILIDGGFQEDVPHIIEKAKEMTGEEKPTVALWLITHPHIDHYGALLEYSGNEDHKHRLNVEKLCIKTFEKTTFTASDVSFAGDEKNLETIIANMGVPVVTPHAGDTWDFDGIKIRMLFAVDEYFDILKDPNELSLIFQVVGSRKKVMFTGDAYHRGANIVAYAHWDDLQSDYCQLAHHGLNGCSPDFYHCVNAPVALIPISVAGDRDVATWRLGHVPRQFAERLAKEVYKAYAGDKTFPL